jgi:hypothetical protein
MNAFFSDVEQFEEGKKAIHNQDSYVCGAHQLLKK